MSCGLNGKDSQRLTVWILGPQFMGLVEELGGAVLLQKKCRVGWALRFQRAYIIPSVFSAPSFQIKK